MSLDSTNTLTLWVFLFPWALFLAWEVYLLIRRAKDVRVKTISMVAKDRGEHLTSVVYVWSGMLAHWWWPSKDWAPVWAQVGFWVVLVALFIWDLVLWKSDAETWPTWMHYVRSPMGVSLLGFAAGKVLFPQAS